jgi:hypothetical protein
MLSLPTAGSFLWSEDGKLEQRVEVFEETFTESDEICDWFLRRRMLACYWRELRTQRGA